MDGEKTKHKSFGMVSFTRTHGYANLFGSDFRHRNYITIRVQRASCEHKLSRDWYYGEQELVEIFISETQLTQLITSLNTGDGVTCTIGELNVRISEKGKAFPWPPSPAIPAHLNGRTEG